MEEGKVGKKFDQNKPMMHILHWPALIEIAKVATMGKVKYGENNWLKGLKWSRLASAMQRHFVAFWLGEDKDNQSKLYHVAHMAWNATALVTCQVLSIGEDDRWIPDDPRIKTNLMTYLMKEAFNLEISDEIKQMEVEREAAEKKAEQEKA